MRLRALIVAVVLPAALAPAAHASQTIGEAAAPNVICPGANAHARTRP